MKNITKEIIKIKKRTSLMRYWRYRNKKHLKYYESKRYKKRKQYTIKLNEKYIPKAGSIIIRKGYKYIGYPLHPHATKKGYILEHRLLMETILGRYLKETEIVHHIDGNKLNNDIKNLELINSLNSHSFLHDKLRNKDMKGRYVSGGDAVP